MKRFISGRSMIEMIATLAIIGVLSAVGVWGLNNALTKHKVNTLIEDVRLAGFIVADALFKSLPDDDEGMNLAGKFEKQTSYEFRAFAEKETTFEILVKNVPYGVCEEVKKRKVEWLEEIKANGIPNTCNEGTSNDISFFFNTELMGNTEQQTKECRANKDCPSAKPYCRNGVCTKCEEGMELNDGSCTECPVGNERQFTTADYCHVCGENYFLGRYGECFECNASYYDRSVPITKEECDRCPNRCWDEENSTCVRTLEGNIFNNDGICNYDCTAGQFVMIKDGSWQCATCPVGNERQFTTADYCHVCGENYFLGRYGECFECNASYYDRSVPITKEECDRCPNRCWDEASELCLLSEEGNVAIRADGTCNHNCTTGQLFINDTQTGINKCVACPAGNEGKGVTTPADCHSCGNNYIIGYYNNNNCWECSASHPHARSRTKEECDRCPNRCWDEASELCLLSEEGNVAIRADGTCNHNCTTGQLFINDTQTGINKCVACPAGNEGKGVTTPADCHSCGNNYIIGYYNNNNCWECSASHPNARSRTKEECDRCPNRYFDETSQLCELCPTGKKASADGLSCVDQ
ncbi:MAG: Tfp pilus assembly protein FimT/FimU [Alphaproteobacteria bacterium]